MFLYSFIYSDLLKAHPPGFFLFLLFIYFLWLKEVLPWVCSLLIHSIFLLPFIPLKVDLNHPSLRPWVCSSLIYSNVNIDQFHAIGRHQPLLIILVFFCQGLATTLIVLLTVTDIWYDFNVSLNPQKSAEKVQKATKGKLQHLCITSFSSQKYIAMMLYLYLKHFDTWLKTIKLNQNRSKWTINVDL